MYHKIAQYFITLYNNLLKFQFEEFFLLFYHQIWTAKIESKIVTSMDILKHRTIIKYCVQAEHLPWRP